MKIEETLVNPDVVIASQEDSSVQLYQKVYEETPVSRKHMLVAVKVLADDAFVITAFFSKTRGSLTWT